MSKRLTKLSSRRKKPEALKTSIISGDKKTLASLNNSDEDFKMPPLVNEPSIESKGPTETQETQNRTESRLSERSSIACDRSSINRSKTSSLPPCPFCSKVFQLGQELTRVSHLKTCGSTLGVSTSELLKIKELEDRQAEEWKAMRLPKASVNLSSTSTSKNKSKTSKNFTLAANLCATSDPHLEMALALSASLAAQDEGKESAKAGNADSADEDSSKENVIPTMKNETTTTKMWLQPPPSLASLASEETIVKKSNKISKTKAKTALQMRTAVERDRQISEQVAAILTEELSSDLGVPFHFKCSDKLVNSDALLQWVNNDSRLWRVSSLTFSTEFYIDSFKPYVSSGKLQEKNNKTGRLKSDRDESKSETTAVKKTPQFYSIDNDESNLADDWKRMLDSGTRSDTIIYTKDQNEIKCHSLVLLARCKSVLDLAMEVKDDQGKNSNVIPWHNISSNVTLAFLRFIYANELPETIASMSDFRNFQALSSEHGGTVSMKKFEDFVARFCEADFERDDLGTYCYRNDPNEDSLDLDKTATTDGGFVSDAGQDEAASPSATQNMNVLLDILEESNTEEVDKGEGENSDQEWDDMCEFLSQKQEVTEDAGVVEVDTVDAELSNFEKSIENEEYDEVPDPESPAKEVTFDSTSVHDEPLQFRKSNSSNKDDWQSNNTRSSKPEIREGSPDLFEEEDDHQWEEACAVKTDRRSPTGDKNYLSSSSSAGIGSNISPHLSYSPNHNNQSASEAASPLASKKKTRRLATAKRQLSLNSSSSSTKSPHSSQKPSQEAKRSRMDISGQSLEIAETEDDPPQELYDYDYLGVDDEAVGSQSPLPEINLSSFTMENTMFTSPSHEKVQKTESAIKNSPRTQPSSKRTPVATTSSSSPLDEVRGRPRERQTDMTPITPMPDYETMLSPALRQELKRFGLKVIPKRKAVPLLKYIYEETHPAARRRMKFSPKVSGQKMCSVKRQPSDAQVDDEEAEEMPLSQESNVSDDGDNDVPEESLVYVDGEEGVPDGLAALENLPEKLMDFIRSRPILHKAVLMYEPIWLEDLFADFKDTLGKAAAKKVKINVIQDILDSECITFRTRARQSKNNRRNAKSKN